MNQFFVSLGTAAMLAIGLIPMGSHAWAAPARQSMSIKILPSSGPRTISGAHAVTFHLKVTGITLDARKIGKRDVFGQGHIQVYVDHIPSDAYRTKDLKHSWLAALAAPVFTLRLSAAVLGGRGRHRIIVALAKNNYVLYGAPTAFMVITVR